jgi:hypothetical protein
MRPAEKIKAFPTGHKLCAHYVPPKASGLRRAPLG